MTEVNTASGEVREVVQLHELARPFPTDFVEKKDGQEYVAHHVVNQRLLSVVGPFDFELVQVLRSDVPAVPPDENGRSPRAKRGTPALHNIVVGGIWRLSCEIDGRRAVVEEVGDVSDVHNWAHDGARLKDAASDAIKRCAMRLGLGLHLWAQEHYFLDQQLKAQREREEALRQKARQSTGGATQVRLDDQAREARNQRRTSPLDNSSPPAWAQQDAPV